MIVSVEGITIICSALHEINVKLKDRLATAEQRLKTIRQEDKKLSREIRKLKAALDGTPAKKAPTAASATGQSPVKA